MSSEHSSFVIQPFRRKELKAYCKFYGRDQLGELMDPLVARVLREQGFSIPKSPRSVYRVEKLYDALAKYEPSKAPRVDLHNIHVQHGVNLAYACFARPKNVPVLDALPCTVDTIHAITSNPSGSPGLTALGAKKRDSVVRAFERSLQQIRGEKRPDPCLAFKRTQFDDKTRLVWGYPYANLILEGLFARPLIERFKLGTTPMAFGMSVGVLGAKLRTSAYHKEFAYSTDVSAFDSSISADLIRVAFKILSTWFNLNECEPTTGISYQKIWKDNEWYFIHTPIVMPDGKVRKGKAHGVPSGSYFTQMVDSIVNVILVGAVSSAFSLEVDKSDVYVLGDDILFWSNRDVNLDHIANFASSLFGMKFNAKKSGKYHWDEPLVYLGRTWTDGVPSLDVEGIIARMSQPERFRKYPKDSEERERCVRQLLLSYAAVYREAYPIYLKCLDIRPRFEHSNQSIEYYVYKGSNILNPDFLSGLERFRMKYLNSGGSTQPLALQFWK